MISGQENCLNFACLRLLSQANVLPIEVDRKTGNISVYRHGPRFYKLCVYLVATQVSIVLGIYRFFVKRNSSDSSTLFILKFFPFYYLIVVVAEADAYMGFSALAPAPVVTESLLSGSLT